jgi:hypothetical protein
LALPLSVAAALAVAAACGSKHDYPTIPSGPYQAGVSGTPGGGTGGPSTATECVKKKGICLAAGDMAACPEPVLGDLCGAASDLDGGPSGLFCCLGLNDAGAPEDAPAGG